MITDEEPEGADLHSKEGRNPLLFLFKFFYPLLARRPPPLRWGEDVTIIGGFGDKKKCIYKKTSCNDLVFWSDSSSLQKCYQVGLVKNAKR